MEIFVYNAAKPREDIGSFNHRVQQYCSDNNVIQAKATMLGPSLIISCTLMEDVEVPLAQTLSLEIHQVDGTSDKLEEQCTALLDDMAERDTPEDPVLPFNAEVLTRPDLCVQGFIVFQLFTGTIASEATEDEEEDD